jgi:hypothetical protein
MFRVEGRVGRARVKGRTHRLQLVVEHWHDQALSATLARVVGSLVRSDLEVYELRFRI